MISDVVMLNHPELLQKSYENIVEEYMDGVVKERNYNSVDTCIGKYLFSPNPKYKAEAEAVNVWNSACWDKCYEILAEVESGKRAIPNEQELIAELPKLEW